MIPIPVVSAEIQTTIIEKVDHIMNSTENLCGLYSELDNVIMDLYHLEPKDREIIKIALSEKNLFIGS